MDLLAYLRVLRRRWVLILALAVAGAAVGAASAVFSETADVNATKHYKAAATLAFEAENDSSSSDSNGNGSTRRAFTNLDQIAVLATTGDVPTRVARRLGEDPHRVSERITTLTDSTSNTLTITAIDTDAKGAERFSDAVVDELVTSLNEKEQTRFDKSSQDTIARLNRLRGEIAALDAQVAGPGASDLVRAERDGLIDQYRITFERFQQLAAQGAPTSGLSPLQSASAVPISSSAYSALLDRGQIGENNERAEDQTTDPTEETSAPAPSLDSPVARGLLGGLLGLLLGIGVALVAERFDRRLRSAADVAAAFDLPVLAEVPRLSPAQVKANEVIVHAEPMSGVAEAYRAVRSSLLFQSAHLNGAAPGPDGAAGNGAGDPSAAETKSLVIMVASPTPGDGKTTTSVNLAAAFAETGASVLVVNCDFRRPMAHTYLRTTVEPRRILQTAIPGVFFVSNVVSDPKLNPAQVVAAQRDVIASARERVDVIVLDTAPLLTANDAIEISSSVDLVLLTARYQATTADSAGRAMERLQRVGAPVAGVVIVGAPEEASGYYYEAGLETGRYREAGSVAARRSGTDPKSPVATSSVERESPS